VSKPRQDIVKPIQAPMERPSADEPTVVLDMKIGNSLTQALANQIKQMTVGENDTSIG